MYLGIDIGGTNARIEAFRDPRDLEPFDRRVFGMSSDYENDLHELLAACTGLRDEHGQIEAIGLAVAGKINDDRSSVYNAGNIGHWAGQPFVGTLAKAAGCRVTLGNDAEAAGMAEALYGHGVNQEFWFGIWGTGVGGCLVGRTGGQPHVKAGEPGHLRVSETQDRVCGCGQYGCLEAYCGGSNIEKYTGHKAEELSEAEWDEVLRWMAIGLRNMQTAQPVKVMYFGGGISVGQRRRLPKLESMLGEELRIVEAPALKVSYFGESAGTIGALALTQMRAA